VTRRSIRAKSTNPEPQLPEQMCERFWTLPWFVSRKKDIIIRGGTNISPAEVEYHEWSIPRVYRGWHRAETVNGVTLTRSPIYVPKRPSGAPWS
jgi:hypothetical protein